MSIKEVIDDAKRSMRNLKHLTPYAFAEWQELCAAERALKEATERCEAAKRRWDEMGT